jgi:site-specific DNA-methyltransferase (adenine-specific)
MTFNLPISTTDVWDFTPDKLRYGHPTQKPQDICQRIIKASSNENDNILIPFAGVVETAEVYAKMAHNINIVNKSLNKQ